MSDERHTRVVSVIKELAAKFIQQEANTDPLITITNTIVSADQKHVTVFFTTIPENRENDALIFLKRSGGDFRHFIKSKARLKVIPHIEFAVDYGERHRQHIDTIVRDIKSEEEN